MQHTVYFLVEPNAEALREFPIHVDTGMTEILLEPLLTSRTFGDRSPWRVEEVELAVKLIYVARMREYTPISEDSVAKRVLGSDEVSIQLFDRWWSVRRLYMEEGRSEEMEDYLVSAVHKVKPTGNPTVDTWLTGLFDARDA